MFRNLLICLFASIALVCAQSSNSTDATTSTSNHTSSTTNSPTNATLAPSTASTSTTKKTESPTTSTTTTTTTVKPPTTTTAKPITTTTVAPPNPPPVPKPETFKGNVTEGNKTCINVVFSVQITIKYNNTNNEEKTTGFTIPTNASIDLDSSSCGDPKTVSTEKIVIRFEKEEHTSANLSLTFNKTEDGSIFVEEVKLDFVATEDLMPGLDTKLYGKTMSSVKNELSLFKVASVHSYVCSAAQSAKLDSQEGRITGVQIEFTDSKVEAYINESNKGNFDSEIDCKSADISDVVPIAVGAALAGLVVIVLIAYFIGRRRSRRLAYQSV